MYMDSMAGPQASAPAQRRRIGGEFEIAPALLAVAAGTLESLPGGGYYSTGRGALAAILRDAQRVRGGDSVLLPDYVCDSVTETVVSLGLRPVRYGVEPALSVDIDAVIDLAREHRAAIVGAVFVDYFGLSECDGWIAAFKSELPEVPVVRDCVQALYEMKGDLPGEYRFSSLRKWLPTPDGAPVTSPKDRAPQPTEGEAAFVADKLLGNIERHWTLGQVTHTHDPGYLHLERGESALDALGARPAPMSRVSRVILSNIDLDEIAVRRRRNFSTLAALMETLGLRPILTPAADRVPHFLPVLVENRDEIRALLRTEGIFCPVHWPRPVDGALSSANPIWERELSLVIDQRYDEEDMHRLGTALGRAITRCGV